MPKLMSYCNQEEQLESRNIDGSIQVSIIDKKLLSRTMVVTGCAQVRGYAATLCLFALANLVRQGSHLAPLRLEDPNTAGVMSALYCRHCMGFAH